MPPLEFNAWEPAQKLMFTWEKNRFDIAMLLALNPQNFVILPFTGLVDKDKNKIFLDDILRIEFKNEFGSIHIATARIIYVPCTYLPDVNGTCINPECVVKLERLGSWHERPELLERDKIPA